MTDDDTFAAFMRKAYLDWQQERGELLEKQQFAKHLGISKQLLGHYMSGRQRPTAERADGLAAVLGPEVYDALGVPRRDKRLLAIIAGWGSLSEEVRERYDPLRVVIFRSFRFVSVISFRSFVLHVGLKSWHHLGWWGGVVLPVVVPFPARRRALVPLLHDRGFIEHGLPPAHVIKHLADGLAPAGQI